MSSRCLFDASGLPTSTVDKPALYLLVGIAVLWLLLLATPLGASACTPSLLQSQGQRKASSHFRSACGLGRNLLQLATGLPIEIVRVGLIFGGMFGHLGG